MYNIYVLDTDDTGQNCSYLGKIPSNESAEITTQAEGTLFKFENIEQEQVNEIELGGYTITIVNGELVLTPPVE